MESELATQWVFTTAPFRSPADFQCAPAGIDILVVAADSRSAYSVGYARSPMAIEAVLRLRYLVFNVELGEGLAEAALTGLDQDPFDQQMVHLVILDNATGSIAGTYRLQSARAATQGIGLYSAQEFDMTALAPYFDETVEIGRACLGKEHRTMDALLTLWHGLGHFMNLYGLHYLMGCGSITSTDPDDGWRTLKTLRKNNYLHPEIFVPAHAAYSCGDIARADDPELGPGLKLPKLFRIYLLLGSTIISEPAIDREFGTVDFLTFIDARQIKLSQLDIIT